MRRMPLLGGACLVATLLLASSAASADRYDNNCRERIERAEMRLDRAIDRWGHDSYRAREARRQLNDVREWCWRHNHQRWWDSHDRNWHTERW